MSEERFSLSNPINHNPIPNWVMIVHDDAEHKHMNAEEIVDLLNSLSEDNEQLRQRNQELNDNLQDTMGEIGLLNGLKEENEQLKEELNNLKKDATILYHYYTLALYGGDGV